MHVDKKEFIKRKLDNSALKHVTAGLAGAGAGYGTYRARRKGIIKKLIRET